MTILYIIIFALAVLAFLLASLFLMIASDDEKKGPMGDLGCIDVDEEERDNS